MKGRPTQKKRHPNKSTICANSFGTVCANSPPFSRENGRKSLSKLFVQTIFIWVGGSFWVGRLPLRKGDYEDFLEKCPHNPHI